jgi:hypothetical protein
VSRYRKIEVKTWMDEKFRGLTAMPPSGQGLWLFLMTGPHTGPIPGLFRAGRAGMAEELGWEMEAFDEAFAEVSGAGMAKADFKARLVWLPKALKHNKPESPNVVRSWRVELDLLPECELKREAIAAVREHLTGIGPSYAEAFDELTDKPAKTTPKHSGKPSSKAMPNQEQEQEQEQEQNKESAAAHRTSRPKREDTTLKTYLQECREAGTKPVPDDHAIRAYCRDAGIAEEMLQVAWCVFRDDYTTGTNKAKRYKDWPGHFANAVRGCWAKLWFTDAGEVKWSSRGLQEKQVLDARMKAKEGGHAPG